MGNERTILGKRKKGDSPVESSAGIPPKLLKVDSSCTVSSAGLVGELLISLEESYKEHDTPSSNNSESEAPPVNRALLPYLESTPVKQNSHDSGNEAWAQPYTPSTGGKSSIESEEDHETPKVSDGQEKRPKVMEPEAPAVAARAIAENLVKLVRDSTRECETEMTGQKTHTAAVLLLLIEKMCREAQKVLA